ncbi:MAG: glucoamylase family protein, partial [Dokdonella sp.]
RAWDSELSTIDTALLLAGALAAASFFDGQEEDERMIRALADALYRRVDWPWALDGGLTLTHGWRPESGFLPYRWEGYDEALILYVLALGSPAHPIPAESYAAWTTSYTWKRIYGHELLYAGPLFIHQYSHMWIDFRDIQDEYMRNRNSDYFKNSRIATLVQREYAIENPLGFEGYGDCCWGFTACDGPGPSVRKVGGVDRQFLGYSARGAPYGPDDGTIAIWAAAASLPFAPEVVLPTLRRFGETHTGAAGRYEFESTFNLTYQSPQGRRQGWVCPWIYGIDQGALALMIDNYRSGGVWHRIGKSPWIRAGLRRAGFDGGWLRSAVASDSREEVAS